MTTVSLADVVAVLVICLFWFLFALSNALNDVLSDDLIQGRTLNPV